MARLAVNPTRMELSKLKKRLVTARRGHKLLKDKRDELMKQFLDTIYKSRDLRISVESKLAESYEGVTAAACLSSLETLSESMLAPKQSLEIDVGHRNIMSVVVPEFDFHTVADESGDIIPYSLATTPAELDDSIYRLENLFPEMLELAGTEKTVQLLAIEIEKTRRRVNALEYVLIPQLEQTIEYITMKLDENERGNLTRLMKVKDMMVEEARAKAGRE